MDMDDMGKGQMITNFRVGCNFRAEIFDAESGEKIGERDEHNLVVDQGLEYLAEIMSGQLAAPALTLMIFGTDDTAVTPGDTGLGNPVSGGLVTINQKEGKGVLIEYYMASTESNGETLAEAGLGNEFAELFARVVFNPIVKNSTINVLFSWRVEFEAVV